MSGASKAEKKKIKKKKKILWNHRKDEEMAALAQLAEAQRILDLATAEATRNAAEKNRLRLQLNSMATSVARIENIVNHMMAFEHQHSPQQDQHSTTTTATTAADGNGDDGGGAPLDAAAQKLASRLAGISERVADLLHATSGNAPPPVQQQQQCSPSKKPPLHPLSSIGDAAAAQPPVLRLQVVLANEVTAASSEGVVSPSSSDPMVEVRSPPSNAGGEFFLDRKTSDFYLAPPLLSRNAKVMSRGVNTEFVFNVCEGSQTPTIATVMGDDEYDRQRQSSSSLLTMDPTSATASSGTQAMSSSGVQLTMSA